MPVKVFTAHPFRLWYAEAEVYIDRQPIEVETSAWLEAQIASGVVCVAEPEPQPKRGKKSEEA
jgi:hypothetical protein